MWCCTGLDRTCRGGERPKPKLKEACRGPGWQESKPGTDSCPPASLHRFTQQLRTLNPLGGPQAPLPCTLSPPFLARSNHCRAEHRPHPGVQVGVLRSQRPPTPTPTPTPPPSSPPPHQKRPPPGRERRPDTGWWGRTGQCCMPQSRECLHGMKGSVGWCRRGRGENKAEAGWGWKGASGPQAWAAPGKQICPSTGPGLPMHVHCCLLAGPVREQPSSQPSRHEREPSATPNLPPKISRTMNTLAYCRRYLTHLQSQTGSHETRQAHWRREGNPEGQAPTAAAAWL